MKIPILIFCFAWTVAAGQTGDGYRQDFDYPGQGDAWYGGMQLPDPNRDYSPTLLDQAASGEDYCLGYERFFDNLTLGPPLSRTNDFRNAYEFRFAPGERTMACIGSTMQCSAVEPPGEVTVLSMEKFPDHPQLSTMTWPAVPGAEVYNIYRASHSNLDNLFCISGGVEGPSWVEGQITGPGQIYYFLVSAANCVGESELGEGTLGPRENRAPCF